MNVVGPGITAEDYENGKAKPIDVFEGRLQTWILAFARHIAHEHEQKDHSGIAVLLLASSVLEPLGGVLPAGNGPKNSEGKFCDGFEYVFKDMPRSTDLSVVAKRVCNLLRHGLYHEASIKAGVVLTAQNVPITEEKGIISIDPARFLDAVMTATSRLCGEIRSAPRNSPSQRSFDAYWNQKESDQENKLTSLVTPGAKYPPECGTSTIAPAGSSGFFTKP
jgi:hypothetical protein